VLQGDVILKLGGQAVARADELASVLDEGKIGVELELAVLRAGAERTLSVKPEAR
jgi:S1-C subfamily serine protease